MSVLDSAHFPPLKCDFFWCFAKALNLTRFSMIYKANVHVCLLPFSWAGLFRIVKMAPSSSSSCRPFWIRCSLSSPSPLWWLNEWECCTKERLFWVEKSHSTQCSQTSSDSTPSSFCKYWEKVKINIKGMHVWEWNERKEIRKEVKSIYKTLLYFIQLTFQHQ